MIGTQLGPYRIERLPRGGGLGEVDLADDMTLGRPVDARGASRRVSIDGGRAEPTLVGLRLGG
jgi:hypothetical protein